MAGLTLTGLEILRDDELLEQIETLERVLIDPAISTNSDEILGNLNTIISAALGSVWALAESVNDNGNLLTTEGKGLDDMGTQSNTPRRAPAKAFTEYQVFTGDNGTVVPLATPVQNPSTSELYLTTTALTLDTSNCLSVDMTPTTVASSVTYTVTIDGTAISFTAASSNSLAAALDGLKAVSDALPTTTWTAFVNDAKTSINFQSDDSGLLSVVATTNTQIDKVSGRTTSEAVEYGVVAAPAQSVTSLNTTISGIDSTSNVLEYTIGTLIESDKMYRRRLLTAAASVGSSTAPSIEAQVAQVDGVTNTYLVENNTFITDDDGRPPYSIELIVAGGSDQAVGTALWYHKGASVPTFGTTTVSVQDSNGAARTVYFTRSINQSFSVRVTYNLMEGETFIGANTAEIAIKAAVVEYFSNLVGGEDVVSNRLIGPIHLAVTGLEDVIVETQPLIAAGASPSEALWTEAKSIVDWKSQPIIVETDVYVREI